MIWTALIQACQLNVGSRRLNRTRSGPAPTLPRNYVRPGRLCADVHTLELGSDVGGGRLNPYADSTDLPSSMAARTSKLQCRMAFLAFVIGGLVFGAGDQYVGTVHAVNAVGGWSISVSLLSAPWLILPFLFGSTQGRPRRAAVTGLVVTLSALAGYFAMTLSPMEGVHFSLVELRGLLGTNQLNEIGGLVAGPLFGWLGYRWHTCRSWLAAAFVTGALCLEPVAVTVAGRNGGRSGFVWILEVVVGLATGTWFLVGRRRQDGLDRRVPKTLRRAN